MNYYNINEVAIMFQLSKTQLYRLCKAGLIEFEKRPGKGCIFETWIPETEFEKIKNRPVRGRPFNNQDNEKVFHNESI